MGIRFSTVSRLWTRFCRIRHTSATPRSFCPCRPKPRGWCRILHRRISHSVFWKSWPIRRPREFYSNHPPLGTLTASNPSTNKLHGLLEFADYPAKNDGSSAKLTQNQTKSFYTCFFSLLAVARLPLIQTWSNKHWISVTKQICIKKTKEPYSWTRGWWIACFRDENSW